MNGIVLVDKAEGITSHDVVMRIRRLYGTKKVGHTGTLDPLATGLLPICIGKATKVAEYVSNNSKSYLASAVRGIRTDTGDTTGTVYAKSSKPIPDALDEVLMRFRGEQLQLPPMHSALKYRGRKLYDYAREGICVPRKKRPIRVSRLEKLECNEESITLLADVSSGTYIRTLIDDIGVEAGCFFTMKTLRRISVGKTSIDQAHTLEEIEAMSSEDREAILLPMDAVLDHISAIRLPEHRKRPMLNGMSSRILFPVDKATYYRVYVGGDFIGIGVLKECDGVKNLLMKKVLK